MAGRSRADKEADADARMRVFVIGGLILGALIFLLHAMFSVVGLRLGWWAVPVFVPLFLWLLVSAACNRVLRPAELDDLRVRQRLAGAGGLLFVLWVVWPLWADPAAGAWKHAHGGFGVASGGARYPLSAVLGASPLVIGVVAFLWVAIAMVLAPRIPAREPHRIAAPGDPEPVRAPFNGPGRPGDRRWP